jgi:hypothetical protein
MTLVWRKSSHSSDGTSSQCVEVAKIEHTIGVRDSKRPEDGHLALTTAQFANRVQHIKHNS